MRATLATTATGIPGLHGLEDPRAAAEAIGAANVRLGRAASVPPDVADLVHALSAAVGDTSLTVWEATDPYLVACLLKGTGEAAWAATAGDRRTLRIALARIEHALRGIADRGPALHRDVRELLPWLVETARVPRRELAALLGVPGRTFQRWIASGLPETSAGLDHARLAMVAEAVAGLRHVLTPAGAVSWFAWPRDDLDGRAPSDLLDDAAAYPVLRRAVARTRSADAA